MARPTQRLVASPGNRTCTKQTKIMWFPQTMTQTLHMVLTDLDVDDEGRQLQHPLEQQRAHKAIAAETVFADPAEIDQGQQPPPLEHQVVGGHICVDWTV